MHIFHYQSYTEHDIFCFEFWYLKIVPSFMGLISQFGIYKQDKTSNSLELNKRNVVYLLEQM